MPWGGGLIVKSTNFTLIAIVFIVLVAIVLRLSFSYFSLVSLPPSGDEAIAVLMANEIANGARYPLLFIGQPYQFPIEAYLMAPLAKLMPHNSFGARYQVLLLGGLSCLIFVLATRALFPKGKRWPGWLLVLIPSAYWLTWQSGYAAPQYSISSVFAILMFYLAAMINQKETPSPVLSLLLGVIAGLSLSNHLLLVSVVIGAVLVAVLNGKVSCSLKNMASYTTGLFLGLIPLFLALHTLPNAYENLAARLPLYPSLQRLFSDTLNRSIPGIMGVNPPYFGDFPIHLEWGDTLKSIAVFIFITIISIVLISRSYCFIKRSRQSGWLHLGPPDMFLGTTVLSMFLMASSTRGSWGDFRYLLPVAWSFPFLVGHVYHISKGGYAKLIGSLVLLIAVFNFASSAAVINVWRNPAIIQTYADIPNLARFQAWMQKQDIKYCYATFWLAYRISYESNGQLICAPVYNERFPTWPVPYKELVDRQKNVAFVVSNSYGSKFSATKFQKLVDEYEVQYQREQIGPLVVYHDFKHRHSEGDILLNSKRYRLSTNIEGSNTNMLSDGDKKQSWSIEPQNQGQFIEVTFDQAIILSSLTFHYPRTNFGVPTNLRVSVLQNQVWNELSGVIPFAFDRLQITHGRPVLGRIQQTIRFPGPRVDAIRIEVATPEFGKSWDLSEISIYTR